MILPDFKAFPRNGRIMGIDWGARRTGVAVSDENRDFVFVRPPVVVGAGNTPVGEIADMARAEKVVGIVVGLPLRTDGTESSTTQMVRDFVKQLSQKTDLPICFIDETLTSSVAAEESKLRTVKEVKEKLDSQSARVILENAISLINRI